MRITESTSNHRHLEKMSVKELLTNMNKEDETVPQAVAKAIPQIERLVEEVVKKMKKCTTHTTRYVFLYVRVFWCDMFSYEHDFHPDFQERATNTWIQTSICRGGDRFRAPGHLSKKKRKSIVSIA